MLPIYVMHNKTLCIKKSYLNRFFELPAELIKDYKVIKKGIGRKTDLLEFSSLPLRLRDLIVYSFGNYEYQKTYKYNNRQHVKFLNHEIKQRQIEIDNLKTSQGNNQKN
jgi:hypothetical protein